MSTTIPVEVIAEKIFEIRKQKVMIDADLARLYGVQTKRINEAVKRNSQRFPDDLMFQLSTKERDIQIAINAIQSILTPPVPPKKKHQMGFGPSDKK